MTITLPAPPKSAVAIPKAKERVTVGSDTVVITDGGVGGNLEIYYETRVLPHTLKGSELTVTGLAAAKVTSEPGTKTLTIKNGSKSQSVELEVVSAKVETMSKP